MEGLNNNILKIKNYVKMLILHFLKFGKMCLFFKSYLYSEGTRNCLKLLINLYFPFIIKMKKADPSSLISATNLGANVRWSSVAGQNY